MKHWEENGFVPVSNFDFIMTEDVIKVMEDLYKCPKEGNYEILKTGKIKCSIHGTIED